jgi:hypothetical protein
MKKQVIAIAIAAALAVGGALAQERMEAVATVAKIDPTSRTVWVEAKTSKRVLHLSPDIDISDLQVGSRYQFHWDEGVATAIEPGAQRAEREADVTRTGPGMVKSMGRLSGVIDSLDTTGKKITLRTADGGKETFALGPAIVPASFNRGDTVTLTYERSLAVRVRSTPQPITDPAPAQ